MSKYFHYLAYDGNSSCFKSAMIFYEGFHFVAHSISKTPMSHLVRVSHKRTGLLIDDLIDKETAIDLVDQYDRIFNNRYTDYGDYYKSWYRQTIDLKRKLLPLKITKTTNFKQFSKDCYKYES